MRIEFNYESDFKLKEEAKYTDWIKRILSSEEANGDSLSYVFCDDAFLAEINLQYLNHNTFTDIISFDYSDGKTIRGDIFISVERVQENSQSYGVTFGNELRRVMAHGILHLLGYDDKREEDKLLMRNKEEEKIKMFHVEQ